MKLLSLPTPTSHISQSNLCNQTAFFIHSLTGSAICIIFTIGAILIHSYKFGQLPTLSHSFIVGY